MIKAIDTVNNSSNIYRLSCNLSNIMKVATMEFILKKYIYKICECFVFIKISNTTMKGTRERQREEREKNFLYFLLIAYQGQKPFRDKD